MQISIGTGNETPNNPFGFLDRSTFYINITPSLVITVGTAYGIYLEIAEHIDKREWGSFSILFCKVFVLGLVESGYLLLLNCSPKLGKVVTGISLFALIVFNFKKTKQELLDTHP